MNPTLMIYALIALQVLDLISTVIALRNPLAYETNQFLSKFFSVLGTLPTLLILKSAFAAYLWYFKDMVMLEAQVLLCAIYAYVVFKNFRLIRGT